MRGGVGDDRSASETQRAACSPPGPHSAIWRRPAAQISRLWVQASGSISQIPASVSGSRQRCSIASTAASAARQPSASRWSWRAAAANSSSASPNASSWNCWLTQLPTMSDAARVAGQVELALVGHGAAGGRVGGLELRAVVEQPLGDEAHGVVHQRVGAGLGDRLAGVALVPDPHVAVVVVAALRGRARAARWWPRRPSRRRRWSAPRAPRRRGGCRAAATVRSSSGTRSRHCGLDALPRPVGVRGFGVGVRRSARTRTKSWWAPSASSSVSVRALPPWPSGCGRRVLASGPAHAGAVELAASRCRRRAWRACAARAGRSPPRGLSTTSTRAVPLPGDHPAQDHRPVGTSGQRERLAALDRRVVGDPAAAPDQAARLVVAAPHATGPAA